MPGITITSRCSRPFSIVLNGRTYQRAPDENNDDVFNVPTADVASLISPTQFVASDTDAGGVTTVTVNIQEKVVAPPDALVAANLTVSEKTSTSARVSWNVHNSLGELTPASGGICYGTDQNNLNIKTNPQPITSPLDFHSQPIPSPGGAALLPDTTYYYQILGEDPVTGAEMPSTVFEFTTDAEQVVTGGAMTYAQIEAAGLPVMQGNYATTHHYIGEFLYQNPNTCYWSVSGGVVSPVAAPAMSNPVVLPAPTGGNDTNNIINAINANPGRNFDGQNRLYKISGANITNTCRLFNMRVNPNGGGTMFIISAADVRFYNVQVDCLNRGDQEFGWQVNAGSHRFHLVGSSYKNSVNTNGTQISAIRHREGREFHYACNEFENIRNTSGSGGDNRANAFWFNGYNGGNTLHPLPGGYIVNNTCNGLQSNGVRLDAEYITFQAHSTENTATPIYVMGNRTVNAGKRFTKHQDGNAQILSNRFEWTGFNGANGTADTRLAQIDIHGQDNVTANGNRIVVEPSRYWEYLISMVHNIANNRLDNCHVDYNHVTINMNPASTTNGHFMFVTKSTFSGAGGSNDANTTATNCSIKGNFVDGTGSVRYHHYTGAGGLTGAIDFAGNNITIPWTIAQVRL